LSQGSVQAALDPGMVRVHRRQRRLARLAAPLWIPLAALYLRFVRGYRIEGVAAARRRFARLRDVDGGPLLICANHLTLVDSLLVAWALGSAWRYLVRFDDLAWNTPERANFADTPRKRLVSYLAKCVPISRGGRRADVAKVLERIVHLTSAGEVALVFPEGGRSRTGRFEPESVAWGVGRIVGSVPGCRVLCVYLRGRSQERFSDWPVRGERFGVEVSTIEPKSSAGGVRRTRDFAQQIAAELSRLERVWSDGRQ